MSDVAPTWPPEPPVVAAAPGRWQGIAFTALWIGLGVFGSVWGSAVRTVYKQFDHLREGYVSLSSGPLDASPPLPVLVGIPPTLWMCGGASIAAAFAFLWRRADGRRRTQLGRWSALALLASITWLLVVGAAMRPPDPGLAGGG